jgi:hypothetical protein
MMAVSSYHLTYQRNGLSLLLKEVKLHTLHPNRLQESIIQYLTPRIRVLIEKFTVAMLVKKFRLFDGSRKGRILYELNKIIQFYIVTVPS